MKAELLQSASYLWLEPHWKYYTTHGLILEEVVDRCRQQIEGGSVGLENEVEFGSYYIDMHIYSCILSKGYSYVL